MLQSLYLNNFAIIDELHIDFSNGFTVITGETGAGKSIIAGSLLLLSGAKIDLSILKNKEKKAIIEAIFYSTSDEVKELFKQHEIDVANEIILRREILPSGTSRCYINDTVVSVNILKEISAFLIDIHSQHQNLQITHQNFQLFVLDVLAKQLTDVKSFKKQYQHYLQQINKLKILKEQQQKSIQEADFLSFQLQELNAIKCTEQEFLELEQKYQTLEHAEEIAIKLAEIVQTGKEQENSTLTQLKSITKLLQSLNHQYFKAELWLKRADNLYFEFKDLISEIEQEFEHIQANPTLLEQLQKEINIVYNLQQKYHLKSYTEILELKNNIKLRLSKINNIDTEILQLEETINRLKNELDKWAQKLHLQRQKASDILVKQITPILNNLGMPNVTFVIDLKQSENLSEFGNSIVEYLFSSNTKIPPQPIEKIASGGELSRVMLSLKTIIAHQNTCETIFFDEIDTGISGEIAYHMGHIMQQLATHIQVISITHLPQVASCGKQHKQVSKIQSNKGTFVVVKDLSEQERIHEIAKMLSAKEITTSALEQAKHLLKH